MQVLQKAMGDQEMMQTRPFLFCFFDTIMTVC